MSIHREPPDLAALFGALGSHGVRFVVTGSTAALLRGVDLRPGDLDIVPALDRANLGRLAQTLQAIDARPDLDGPFGDWTNKGNGEWQWIQREAMPGERDARAAWRPDPDDVKSYDHQLETRYGALDIVPEVSGSYEDLMPQATMILAFGTEAWVEAIDDLLSTITVPRREKDSHRVRMLRTLQRKRST